LVVLNNNNNKKNKTKLKGSLSLKAVRYVTARIAINAYRILIKKKNNKKKCIKQNTNCTFAMHVCAGRIDELSTSRCH
jgi:hypothetical protein